MAGSKGEISAQVRNPRGEAMRAPDEVAAMVRLRALGWGVRVFGGRKPMPTYRAHISDFQIAYGRYSAGNPNCAAPTPPALAAVAERAAKTGASTPVPGTGTR